MSQVGTVKTDDPFERVKLGATDVLVSRLAWGMWRFQGDDLAHARALVDAAFDAGINLFDTADIYGFNGREGFGNAEVLLGRLFAADPGLRRTDGARRARAASFRACRMTPARTTWSRRAKLRCVGSAPITSIFSRCTDPTC